MELDTAVILAAGYGSRLGNLTNIIPKSMLAVGEKTILDRNLDILQNNGVKTVYIVTGFGEEIIKKHIAKRKQKGELELEITFVYNPDYGNKNNFYSLYVIKDFIKKDFYLLNSDLIYVESIFSKLKNFSKDVSTFIIDDYKELGTEEMKIIMDEKNNISQFGKYISPQNAGGEYIGVAKITLDLFNQYLSQCEELLTKKQYNHYYEDVFSVLLMEKGAEIKGLSTDQAFWMEIDTAEDLRNSWDYIDILS